MNKKIFISFITAVVLVFNSVGFCICSCALNENEVKPETEFSEQVSAILTYEDMGELICSKELYDSNDILVAYCIETANGYIIYDVNGDVIEYSPSNPSPYKDVDSKPYYSGLFGYYEKNGDEYENVYNGTKSDSINFVHITDEKEPMKSVGSEYSTKSSNVLTDTLPYEPRQINYNKDGLNACGSMATTIIFLYFYDHICSSFANPLLSGTPFYMFETLRQEIEPEKEGTSPDQLRNGILNNFKHVTTLTGLNLQWYNNINCSSFVNNYKSLIEYTKIPCWLLTLTYQYGPHWVVGYGYKKIITSTEERRLFIVNDGQGRNDVRIDENDVSYMMYIKSYKTNY